METILIRQLLANYSVSVTNNAEMNFFKFKTVIYCENDSFIFIGKIRSRISAMEARLASNQKVVGSSPTCG